MVWNTAFQAKCGEQQIWTLASICGFTRPCLSSGRFAHLADLDSGCGEWWQKALIGPERLKPRIDGPRCGDLPAELMHFIAKLARNF